MNKRWQRHLTPPNAVIALVGIGAVAALALNAEPRPGSSEPQTPTQTDTTEVQTKTEPKQKADKPPRLLASVSYESDLRAFLLWSDQAADWTDVVLRTPAGQEATLNRVEAWYPYQINKADFTPSGLITVPHEVEITATIDGHQISERVPVENVHPRHK